MSNETEEYTISISDPVLFERLKAFSELKDRSREEVTEQALREYLAREDADDDQPPEEDVFNPDPGA